MQVSAHNLAHFAQQLRQERKRQGLTRTQAAGICNVSESFIRDAESEPSRCSLGLLLQLTSGLGLRIDVAGWSVEPTPMDADTGSAP
jgi:HTH-type transcriptional regulator / antitoxin HipB